MSKKVMAYEKEHTVGGDTRWFELELAAYHDSEGDFARYLFVEGKEMVLLVGNSHGAYVYESLLDGAAYDAFKKAANKLDTELKC